MAWYQPGSTTLTGGQRLDPTTILDSETLKNNTTRNSTTTDVSNFRFKTLTIKLESTGTISDYRINVTALSSRDDVAADYAEIVSEVYEEDGTYHWNFEDSGKYFRVDVKSNGTADNSNYVTVTVVLEASAS